MIIEFCGLPGGGKTTVAKKIEKDTGFRIIKINSNSELLFLNLIFLFKNPLKFMFLLALIVKNSVNLKEFYLKFTNLFLVTNAKYQKALKCEQAIIDQGYWQGFLSIFKEKKESEDLIKYLKFIVKPDQLFVFDLPLNIVEERNQNRGYFGRESLGRKYVQEWKKIIFSNYEILKNWINVNQKESLINSNQESENICNDILEKINKNNSQNIAYITNLRIPTRKAHGYQICKMCSEFAQLGINVELIIPQRVNNIKEDIFDFYDLSPQTGSRSAGDHNFSVQFVKFLDFLNLGSKKIFFYLNKLCFGFKLFFVKISPNTIIYTRDPEIAWLFKIKKYKVVFSAHNWPASNVKLFKYFLRKVDYVICNSKGTAEIFSKNGFKNSLIAPNAVDLNDFQKECNLDDKRLNLIKDKKIIMYVGHLYEWKGIDVIIQAANFLKENKDIVFVLVGGDQENIDKYVKIKEDYNLDNLFILGHVRHNLIPQYLQRADILVLPNIPVTAESEKYTSPIKLFEYMASKKPIVCSDLPSIKNILDDNSALFFEAGNAQDLSEKIKSLLNNRDLADNLAKNAFEKVKNNTWQNRAKNILKFIR